MPPRKDKNRVPREKRALPTAPKKDAERVAKVIARAGLGSRREVEDWIAEGRVAVNGAVLESPAVTVTAADTILVDGQPLPERERTRLFIYHKPRGVVTTNRDPEGRTTLFELLPGGLPRLVSVGRLDLNSEGLLLLTNDGGLARVLELPETGWLRRYRVRAHGDIDQARLDALLKGITVEGVEYGPIEAQMDRVQGANVWITVALREGKNREVRNVLGALGLKVGRLIRTSYGPFQLGEQPEGAIEEVRTRILRDQIGQDIAAASGADFEGPILEREAEEPPARPQSRRPAGRGKPDEAAETPRRPARGRTARESFEAEAEPEAQRPRGPRRRLAETHDLQSRGTVSDRKGRTVKVERAVAAPAPTEGRQERAASGAGKPVRGRTASPPRDRRTGTGARPSRPKERPDARQDGGWRDERPSAPARTRAGGSFTREGERPARSHRTTEAEERPARAPRFRRDDTAGEARPPRPPRERTFRSEGGSSADRRTAKGEGGPASRGRSGPASGPRRDRDEGFSDRPYTGRSRKDDGRKGGSYGERADGPAGPRGARPPAKGAFRGAAGQPSGPRGSKGPSAGRPPAGKGGPRGPKGPGGKEPGGKGPSRKGPGKSGGPGGRRTGPTR